MSTTSQHHISTELLALRLLLVRLKENGRQGFQLSGCFSIKLDGFCNVKVCNLICIIFNNKMNVMPHRWLKTVLSFWRSFLLFVSAGHRRCCYALYSSGHQFEPQALPGYFLHVTLILFFIHPHAYNRKRSLQSFWSKLLLPGYLTSSDLSAVCGRERYLHGEKRC